MIDDCVNSKQLCKKLTCSKTLNCRSTDCKNCVSLQLLITRSFSAVRVEKKEQCYDAKVNSEKNNTLYLWVSWVTSVWPFKKFFFGKVGFDNQSWLVLKLFIHCIPRYRDYSTADIWTLTQLCIKTYFCSGIVSVSGDAI